MSGESTSGNKRILVTGSREFKDYRLIEKVLAEWRRYGYGTVIHGAARGADSLADQAARSYGYNVIRVPAEWDRYGKRAGPIRNQKMLDDFKPDIVIAFHEDLTKSKGTIDMVRRAIRAGLTVYTYPHNQKEWKL